MISNKKASFLFLGMTLFYLYMFNLLLFPDQTTNIPHQHTGQHGYGGIQEKADDIGRLHKEQANSTNNKANENTHTIDTRKENAGHKHARQAATK